MISCHCGGVCCFVVFLLLLLLLQIKNTKQLAKHCSRISMLPKNIFSIIDLERRPIVFCPTEKSQNEVWLICFYFSQKLRTPNLMMGICVMEVHAYMNMAIHVPSFFCFHFYKDKNNLEVKYHVWSWTQLWNRNTTYIWTMKENLTAAV